MAGGNRRGECMDRVPLSLDHGEAMHCFGNDERLLDILGFQNKGVAGAAAFNGLSQGTVRYTADAPAHFLSRLNCAAW